VHVTSGSGLRKFLADGFLFDRVYNTPHYNYNLHSKCIPQKVIKQLTPTSSSESPDMTHTLTTGTLYSAVMGIGEEEIPHLQSIASTYMMHWGKGLPVCIVLDLKLMTHTVTYSSIFLHDATPTLPTEHSNLIKHSSYYI